MVIREFGMNQDGGFIEKQGRVIWRSTRSMNSVTPSWLQSVAWSRTVSLLIAIVYLVVACLSARSAANAFLSILIVGGALLFPLACIWFADELGEYVGVLP